MNSVRQVVNTSEWELSNAAYLCAIISIVYIKSERDWETHPGSQNRRWISQFDLKARVFDNAVVAMNSQQLKLHAQGLHKIKPIKISAQVGEEIMKFH